MKLRVSNQTKGRQLADRADIADTSAKRRTGLLKHTGLQTGEGIQQSIVAELTGDDVRYIALTTEFDDIEEPNESARSSGVFVLDDYIRNAYEPAATFGFYRILKKKTS